MIGKLICFIAGVILLAFFAGFNLDNKCDVNILFHTFNDVPVMFTIVFSFVIGILVAIPICYLGKAQRKDKAEVQAEAEEKLLKKQQLQEEKDAKLAAKKEKLALKEAKKAEKKNKTVVTAAPSETLETVESVPETTSEGNL